MNETETPSENKPKDESKPKRVYKRKPKVPVAEPEPVTDRDGMEAIVEPEAEPVVVPEPVREIPPPPPPPIKMNREDLDPKAITMEIVPSVGPSLTDDFIQVETKVPKITMQNTSPVKFPWQKPKEKKTTRRILPPMITMSSMPSRRGR